MHLDLPDLVTMSASELRALHDRGHRIALADVEGFLFEGLNLSHPRLLRRLTWSKFAKTFYRDPRTSRVRGWNEAVEQTPLDEAWSPRTRRGQRIVYGHYEVTDDDRTDHPTGLLIRYDARAGSSPSRLDASRTLYDPLVALHPDSGDLLLGYTYVSAGRFRLNTPTWFALRRGPELDHIAPRPRG